MAARIDKIDPRYGMYKSVVECCLIAQANTYPGQNFAATIDGLFVSFVVLIAQAEGRPMSASKIANYLNMPRTTALRRLQELCDLNVIVRKGTKYYVPESRQKPSPHVLAQVRRVLRKVELSG